MLEIRVANKYRLGKKIGSGSFGEIFLGVNIQTGEEVAVKLENASTRNPQLSYESKMMKMLQEGEGIPSLIWYGIEGCYNILIMELLGPSIEDLFHYCNQKLSLKTTLILGEQVLSRLEYMHSKNFIHRDIKPDNFLMGLGEKSGLLHMIDFGLAKKFKDPRTSVHIPMKEGKSLTGTARYASINTHAGIEQSRRDDLESVFYMLAYLVLGSLPWQGVPADTKQEKYQKILDIKRSYSTDKMYYELPPEFLTYYSYCRSLKFDEKPDYTYLNTLIQDIMVRENYYNDFIYDWTIINYTSHKPLKPKLIEDFKPSALLDDSRQVFNESKLANENPHIQNPQINDKSNKNKKCVVI